tara:strand:+ start:731 stop:934 length:204 start_codon:yes stop_codon:yes gene_type:complete
MKLSKFKLGNWSIEFRNGQNVHVAPVLNENELCIDTVYVDIDGSYLHSKRRIMELHNKEITIITKKI